MFLGQYTHAFDIKGRLTIPSRFRELLLVDGAYITQGFDRNLMVLTEDAFSRISLKVNAMNLADPNARALRRMIFASATRVEIDKAGRILVPDFLRQHAGLELEGDAIIVGAGNYFEIWSRSAWGDQTSQLQDPESNSQRFSVLDLSI